MDENRHEFINNFNGSLTFDYIANINYAMCHNLSPAIISCVLSNTDTQPWNDIEICVAGPMIMSDALKISSVPQGANVDVTKKLKLKPNPDEMVKLQEACLTTITLTVTISGQKALDKELPLRLMPYDQWTGIKAHPELIASFVTPNHPMLSRIAVSASKFMQQWTGNPSLDEYQSGNPNRVRQQVAAIYESLRSEGLVYVSIPASFESTGQRVRTADKVLNEKVGTCLDLTLLFASCLESIGIHPMIVMLKGHCLLGAWLTDHDNCMVGDDITVLLKSAADGLNELVLIETTALTNATPVTFDDAVAMAMDALHDESKFVYFVNIDDCRLNNILPMPMRVHDGDKWVVVNENEGRVNATNTVRHYDRYDLSAYDTDDSKVTKYTIWERKLLDFSLRNNLLNMRLGKKIIPLVSFNIDKLEDNLQDGISFKVQPFPLKEAANIGANGIPDSTQYQNLEETVNKGLSNRRIYSFHSEDQLKEALKYAYRASRTSLEENGANNLYLVLGVLRWYETDKQQQPRLAPILLLPIELKRALGGGGYDIRSRDEEIVLNVTLTELLKQQHDINLSMLSELPKDEHGVDVKKILAIIRDKIRDKRGWNVLDESMIGLFSFNKFVMWNDIHTNAPLLHKHPIISSLVDGKLNIDTIITETDAKDSDLHHKPSQYAIPIDVDSSQLEAIMDAGEGHSFILHGPPGTGKSQTITNIIANALYHGKRVLFVAEKMAALSVVQSRLEKIGLAPFCLELHSNKVTKQHFLTQMDTALNIAHLKPAKDYQHEAELLYDERQKLIGYVEALHRKSPGGLSLHDCITSYLAIDGDIINVNADDFMAFTRSDIEGTIEKIEQLDSIIKITGNPSTHPLRDLDITDGSAQGEDTLKREIAACFAPLQSLASMQGHDKALPLCIDSVKLDTISQAVNSAINNAELNRDIASRYGQDILKEDLTKLTRQWQEANAKWFIPRYFARRSILKRLAMTPADIEYLISSNDKIRSNTASLQPLQYELIDIFGTYNMDNPMEAKRISLLIDTCRDISSHLSNINRVASVNISATSLPETMARWNNASGQLRNWYLWCKAAQDLRALHLDSVLQYVAGPSTDNAHVSVSGAIAAKAFAKGLYYALASKMISTDANLRHFNGLLFDEAIEHYRKTTAQFQELSKCELYSRLAAQIPAMTMAAHDSSEIGILKRNIKNGGRGTSIRKIIDQIPTLLPKLCPCMLMSPLSVAQYIDLKNEKFDLVIFDEASQMPTSEAVGAIARGNALIVVGDPKQMPPTSFFSTSAVGEDEAYIDDMESILDDCISLSIPSKYLTWHYRSKHESLIAFSNAHYYEGKLLTFPSVDDRERKVSMVPVDGVYDKGRSRSNINEARAIVNEVLRRLADPELSKRSIGIVSFSKVQQDKIEDILTEELAKHPDLEALAFGSAEPIFVKNLENVQGDERDVILFSIGYGPDKDGKVSMNFGPLNNAGGERRLNVAVSRARYEMIVYSSLRSEQIDLRRTNALGVEGLKHFLEFAEKGSVSIPVEQSHTIETDQVAKEIADILAEHGYKAQLSVGRSKFKIDIAVINPDCEDEFMLGILCDGQRYYETKTMRDREIVQPTVLGNLKWQIMKVWSLDWFERRDQVVGQILDRLEKIRKGIIKKPTLPAAKEIPMTKVKEVKPVEISTDYVAASKVPDALPNASIDEMMNNKKLIARQLNAIIKAEQPITTSLLYKRIAKLWDIRLTAKIQGFIDSILQGMPLYSTDANQYGATYWIDAKDADKFKGFRVNSGRDISDVPAIEIENAMLYVIDQQLSLDKKDLKRLTANQLGYNRAGTVIDATLEQTLQALLIRGDLVMSDNKVKSH